MQGFGVHLIITKKAVQGFGVHLINTKKGAQGFGVHLINTKKVYTPQLFTGFYAKTVHIFIQNQNCTAFCTKILHRLLHLNAKICLGF